MVTFNYRIHKKLEETFSLEPNDLGVGFLTAVYKKTTSYLKSLPFLIIIPLSFLVAVLLYLLIGGLAVKLATLLQYGF